jgi:hypothetical protein
MATYRITKIHFSNTPSAAQNGTLEYKAASASTYTLVNSSVDVGTDGTVLESPALQITGLTSGHLYDIRFSNNCSSPVDYWVNTITAP